MSKDLILNGLARLRNIPLSLLTMIVLMLLLGLFVMNTASGGDPTAMYFKKQCLFATIFFFVMLFVAAMDFKWFFNYAYHLYALSLVLLISVTIVGHTAMGATRWLNLGFIKVQPSELLKITLVLALARYFHFKGARDLKYFGNLIIPVGLVAVPLIIIIKQPDLGTGITLLCISMIMFFLAGVRAWKFAASFALVAAACPIIWKYLHVYQKKRILVFFNPESDPLGSGYNIIQSKIAIGSGGFWGKGMLSGTQAHLNFLPEHQTDFVFSLFAESFGFVGSFVLIALFVGLILFGTHFALKSRHQFGRLVVFGLTSVFSVNAFINLGMVTGLLPVVGIPLPFLSYGGSSLATTLILFGIIMNVAISYNATIPNDA